MSGLLWLAVFALVLGIFSTKAKAASDLVEVRTADDVYQSYRQRRNRHGFQFGLQYENYRPADFVSAIDEAPYEDLFGNSNVGLMGIEAGYKFNTDIGSFSALVGYAMGQLTDGRIGQTRKLDLQRLSGKVQFILDTVWSEPYVAPYGSFGVYTMNVSETISETDESFSGKTALGTIMSAGLLFQLNWIEPDTARSAYMDTGIQNTYLDLFVSQMGRPNAEADPELGTSFNWGAGLRFEF